MTQLRRKMLEELQRRNYAQTTIKNYLGTVESFAKHFGRSPDHQAVALRWSWSSDSMPGNSSKPTEVTLTRLDSRPLSNRSTCHPTRTPGVRLALGSERRAHRNLRQTALLQASATAGKVVFQPVRRFCQLKKPAPGPRNTIQIP